MMRGLKNKLTKSEITRKVGHDCLSIAFLSQFQNFRGRVEWVAWSNMEHLFLAGGPLELALLRLDID